MRITPETIRTAYEFLSTCDPFDSWNLPHGDDVTFQVNRSRVFQGLHDLYRGRHRIRISERHVSTVQTLMIVVAHEMIHVHENEVNIETRAEHSEAFWKLADQVCSSLGFNRDGF